MDGLWAVVVGGAIGIAGTLIATAMADVLARRSRREERGEAIHQLLGQQAALKSRVFNLSGEELLAQHNEIMVSMDRDLRANSSLRAFMVGYIETSNAHAVSLLEKTERLADAAEEAEAAARRSERKLEVKQQQLEIMQQQLRELEQQIEIERAKLFR